MAEQKEYDQKVLDLNSHSAAFQLYGVELHSQPYFHSSYFFAL